MILLNFLILIEFFRPLSILALPVESGEAGRIESGVMSSCLPNAGEGWVGSREQVSQGIEPAITPDIREMAQPEDGQTHQGPGVHSWGPTTTPAGAVYPPQRAEGMLEPVDRESHHASPEIYPPPAQFMQSAETSGMQAQPERIPPKEEFTHRDLVNRLKAMFVKTVGRENIEWSRKRAKDVKEKITRKIENMTSQQQHIRPPAGRIGYSGGPSVTDNRPTQAQLYEARMRIENAQEFQNGVLCGEMEESTNENPRPAQSGQTSCLDTHDFLNWDKMTECFNPSNLPSCDPFAPVQYILNEALACGNGVVDCCMGTAKCCAGTGECCLEV